MPNRRYLLPLGFALLVATGVVQLRAARDFEVAKPSENIRAAPEGRQVGSLLEGARIEEIGREGRWVHFRLEGWIWGPSLEGYQAEPPPAGDAEGAEDHAAAARQRLPRKALATHLDEVRRLVDDGFGTFYGMSHDADVRQIQVRLRVRDLEREALERRQMRLQHALLEILTDLDFDSIRIETNRPDGSGEVGVEMAVTPVEGIRRVAGRDLELWRQVTRRSSDGGASWTAPAPSRGGP